MAIVSYDSKLQEMADNGDVKAQAIINLYQMLGYGNIDASNLASKSITASKLNINVGCSVYLAANQNNLTSSEWTKILFDTESWDLHNDFTASTFTCSVPGRYYINSSILWDNVVADKELDIAIYKNGALAYYEVISNSQNTTQGISQRITKEMQLAINDYIEIYARQVCVVDTVDVVGGVTGSYLDITFLSN